MCCVKILQCVINVNFVVLRYVALSPITLMGTKWQPLCALHGALLETDFIGAIHVLSITLYFLPL